MLFVNTERLRVAYREHGNPDGEPLFLLHGWPDDVRTFDQVVPHLHRAGFRTFAPWLRGFGPTRFRSAATMRSGEAVALAREALDFADALQLPRFSIVGRDWGARIAYWIAATAPERLDRIAALSIGWQPGAIATPGLAQARAFWYQWFMTTANGAKVVRRDGRSFARFQWETWGPPGWFSDDAFAATAVAFENPDWAAITLHAYRVRWGAAEPDPEYDAERHRYAGVEHIAVPTLMVQGGDDRCALPASSEGKEQHFSGSYRRIVLDGVGHFPTREAPDAVGRLLSEFLAA